jgi:hypothetical protein
MASHGHSQLPGSNVCGGDLLEYHFQTMRRFTGVVGNPLIVMSGTLVVCTCAWLVTISHGPLATVFLKGAVGYAIGDACFYLSSPGWFVAVGIWGYDSGASVLSSCLVVGVNTVLYGMVVILLRNVARYFPR